MLLSGAWLECFLFFCEIRLVLCSGLCRNSGRRGRRVPPSEVRQQHYELRLSGEEPLSLTAARLGHSICRILFIYFFPPAPTPPPSPPVATAEANHNLPDPKNLKPEQRPRFTGPQTRLSDSKRRAGGGRSKSISEMNCQRRCYQIREMTSFWSHSL